MTVHVGMLVRKRLQELGMTKSEFARRINTTPQNVYGILKRKSLDTQLLQKISRVLDFDFFSALQAGEVGQASDSGSGYRLTKEMSAEELREAYERCLVEIESLKKDIKYLKEINDILREGHKRP